MTAFFCIEKGNEAGSNLSFVCSWTKEYCHRNHGNCILEDDEDFIRCASIFMYEEYGMKRQDSLSEAAKTAVFFKFPTTAGIMIYYGENL